MLAYYLVLRSVLRLKPWLRKCLVRCRHCRIFFLTDVRNVGRTDLGCPFGCREHHCRRQSTRRSVAYYQEPEGKEKKRALNARRRKTPPPPPPPVAPTAPATPTVDWPRPLLGYLCVLVGLIEARKVSVDEVVEMLQRSLRQHRMVRTRRVDQAVAWLNAQPP